MPLFNALQKKMIGHAALILLVAMCAGVGLLISSIGAVELIPGKLIALDIPGNPGAWARTHVGGILNALLIFVIALLVPGLGFSQPAGKFLGGIMIGTGWANTLFYWAAMFAPNRALSFASNRFGSANLATVIGLAPALLFVVLSIVAVAMIAWNAFQPEPSANRFRPLAARR